MRCPKCTERNSVAARKCEFCGERFKRKPLPLGLKLTAGGLFVALSISLAASYVVPKLVDPAQNLARAAKRLAAGPTSPDDAARIKKEFSEAIKAYLKDVGNARSGDIAASLQKVLESTAFEVHIAELPRGLKLVEVDTLLQATDFLVMKTTAGIKVFDLPYFEVFDDARILNDSAGPVLALLGHSGGQPPHHPELRAYALLPDFISDETDKLVPVVNGDGTAKFDKDGQNVRYELALPSMAKADNIDLQSGKNEVIHVGLQWKDAHYNSSSDLGQSSAAVAYLVAQAVHHPDTAPNTKNLVAAPVLQFAKTNAKPATQPLTVCKIGSTRKGGSFYILQLGGDQNFVASEQRTGTTFNAIDVRRATKAEVAQVTPAKSATAVAAVPQPAASPAPATAATTPITREQIAATSAPAETKPPVTAKKAQDKIVVRTLSSAPAAAPEATQKANSGAALAAAPMVPIAKPAAVTPQPVAAIMPAPAVGSKRPVKAAPPAVATPVATTPKEKHHHSSASQTSTAYISGGSGATLRADATTGAKALSSISHGESLQVIGQANGWYHVHYAGREGWVYGGLVSMDRPSAPQTTVATSHKSGSHSRRGDSTGHSSTVASSQPTHERRHHRQHDRNSVVANAPKHNKKAAVVEPPQLVP